MKILMVSVFSLVMVGCFSSIPCDPEGVIGQYKGVDLEYRVERSLSRRPIHVYSVYRDSIGNYVQHGQNTLYFKSGQIKLRENWFEGVRDGKSEFWFENGHLEGRIFYEMGKIEGPTESWYPNGKLRARKIWKNGVLDGLQQEWHIDGKIKKEILWMAGKIVKK